MEEKVGRKLMDFSRRNKYLFSFATGLLLAGGAKNPENWAPFRHGKAQKDSKASKVVIRGLNCIRHV